MNKVKASIHSAERHNIGIKLEHIEIGQQYAITINPKHVPDIDDEVNVRIWNRQQYDKLIFYKDKVNLIVYLESSPKGRLHYHGTYIPTSYINHIVFLDFLKDYGQYKIDTIGECNQYCEPRKDFHEESCTGLEKWIKYCTKQSHIFGPLFEKSLIPYPMKIFNGSKSIVIK